MDEYGNPIGQDEYGAPPPPQPHAPVPTARAPPMAGRGRPPTMGGRVGPPAMTAPPPPGAGATQDEYGAPATAAPPGTGAPRRGPPQMRAPAPTGAGTTPQQHAAHTAPAVGRPPFAPKGPMTAATATAAAAPPPPPPMGAAGGDDEYGGGAPATAPPPSVGAPKMPPPGKAPAIGRPPFAAAAPAAPAAPTGGDDEYGGGAPATAPPPTGGAPKVPLPGRAPTIGGGATAATRATPAIGRPPFAAAAAVPAQPPQHSGGDDEYGGGAPPTAGAPRVPPPGRAPQIGAPAPQVPGKAPAIGRPPFAAAAPAAPQAPTGGDDEYGGGAPATAPPPSVGAPKIPPPGKAPAIGRPPFAAAAPAAPQAPAQEAPTGGEDEYGGGAPAIAPPPTGGAPKMPPPGKAPAIGRPPFAAAAPAAPQTPAGGDDEYGGGAPATAPPPSVGAPKMPPPGKVPAIGRPPFAAAAPQAPQAPSAGDDEYGGSPVTVPPAVTVPASADEYGNPTESAPQVPKSLPGRIVPGGRMAVVKPISPARPPFAAAAPQAPGVPPGGDDEYGGGSSEPPAIKVPPQRPHGMAPPPAVAHGGDDEYGSNDQPPKPGVMTPPARKPPSGTWKAPTRQSPSPGPATKGPGMGSDVDEYGMPARQTDEYGPGLAPPVAKPPPKAEQVVKVRQHVKPTALITLPQCVKDRPTHVLYALNETDRTTWMSTALQSNPHVAEVRERVYPLHRGIAFCRIYHPGQKAVRENLTQTHVVQLILQHLQMKGFKETRRVLEREAHVKTPKHRLHSSRLVTYLKGTLRDTEAVYDLLLGEKVKDQQPLDEHLWKLGLQEEEEEQEDVDIWSETEGNLVVDTTGPNQTEVVKHGSFNRLVEKLTDETKVDTQSFLPTFLMTYQSFTTPEKLLQKLIQRFNVPPSVESNEEGKKKATRIRARVCNVMKKWVEEYPGDFDDRLVSQMKLFIDHAMSSTSASFVSAVSKSFQKMVSDTKKTRAVVRRAQDPPDPIVPPNFFSRTWTLLDLDEEEIARQLTLIDWEIYEKIKPSELLNQSWNKPKLKHRAMNVLAMSKSFNRISSWASTEIVMQPTVRDRVRVLAKFIKIGERLALMNNYNSLMSIAAAINVSSVSRLKYTLEELPPSVQKTKKDLEDIMKSDNNWRTYRARLAALSTDIPCIPYLGMFLTDLTFVDENPNMIHGLINFSKRNIVYNIISIVQQRQQKAYNIQPVQQIIQLLKKVTFKDDPELFQLSLKREPRGAIRASIK